MREIKFRGKRVDNAEWVYGLPLYSVVGGKAIIDTIQSCEDLCFYTVIPETVGQFTGLKDKNGKEVFEGDIAVFESVFSKDKFVGRVRYYSGCKPILWDGKYSIDLAETNEEDLEVIGDMFGNPELLEENNG